VEDVDLALGAARGDRRDVARGVVEDRVDPQRHLTLPDHQRRAVTHVRVPQPTGAISLPSPTFALARASQRPPEIEVVIGQQTSHGRGGDLARFHAPLVAQRAQDQRDRGTRVLAPNREDKFALLFGQRLGMATATAHRLQAGEAVGAVAIVPALQRRGRQVRVVLLPGGM
jgi:hypothetical protein